MKSRVQIHGPALPGGLQAQIRDELIREDMPLEAGIDHLLAINRILVRKIKDNERKFQEQFKQQRTLNSMLLKRISTLKNGIETLYNDQKRLDTHGSVL